MDDQMVDGEYVGVSKAAHSWGQGGENDQIMVIDEPEGLRIVVLQYSPTRTEIEHTIPIEYVPSLIRTLLQFSTDGAIAQAAERQGMKTA